MTSPHPAAPPHSPAQGAAATATTTLYHHGAGLQITQAMTAVQALQAIAAWAQTVPGGMEPLVHRVPVGESEPGGDRQACGNVVRDLRMAMRRDLGVADPASVTGKTLLLTGLAVPVEICGLHPQPAHADRIVIDLLAKTAPEFELRLSYHLANAPLGTQDAVDVMYTLAPALAALFHAHDLTPTQLPAQLGRKGVRPRVPRCIMEPAESAPCLRLNPDAHVANLVMYAQYGLRQCGYHMPDLGDIALVDMTLGTWLRAHTATVHDTAQVEDMLVPELRGIMHDMECLTQAMDRLQKRLGVVRAYATKIRRLQTMPSPLP